MPTFIFKPGAIAARFLQGKRNTYLHPIQMYVFFSFFFLLTLSQISKNWDRVFEKADYFKNGLNVNFSPGDSTDQEVLENSIDSLIQEGIIDSTSVRIDSTGELAFDLNAEEFDRIVDSNGMIQIIDSMFAIDASNQEIIDELVRREPARNRFMNGLIGKRLTIGMLNMYKNKGKGIVSAWLSQLSIISVVFVPIYALLLWLFHMRKPFSFAEHLVHALYLFSFVFLYATLLLLISKFSEADGFAFLSFFIIPPIYFLISFKKVYKNGWIWNTLALSIISFVFGIVLIAGGSLLSILLTFANYN